MAGTVGTMLFLALMFFAALQHAMSGQWPSGPGLAVLAGYTVLLGLLAWRWFRWE